uniref:Uncharacterized protein n=1 Tax=Sphaeramia orbicularis TaxID=375764 RepID=A0A673ARZ4_9TELE
CLDEPGFWNRYDLCVLAAWDDTATTLTATNVVGCAGFFTQDHYPQCRSLPGQLLGGTMILVSPHGEAEQRTPPSTVPGPVPGPGPGPVPAPGQSPDAGGGGGV